MFQTYHGEFVWHTVNSGRQQRISSSIYTRQEQSILCIVQGKKTPESSITCAPCVENFRLLVLVLSLNMKTHFTNAQIVYTTNAQIAYATLLKQYTHFHVSNTDLQDLFRAEQATTQLCSLSRRLANFSSQGLLSPSNILCQKYFYHKKYFLQIFYLSLSVSA